LNRYDLMDRGILSPVRLPVPPLRLIIYKLMEKFMERKTGFEPATLALARRCSTTELLPLVLSKMVPQGGIEPPTRGFSVHCSTD
jgi:hypothetical protein